MLDIFARIIEKSHPVMPGNPRQWSKLPAVQKAFLAASRAYDDSPKATPHFSGRGIVVCGGGCYLPSAWVCVRSIRHFGCQLPIQLWHIGQQELDAEITPLLRGLGVELVDAFRFARESRVLQNPSLRLARGNVSSTHGGWHLKALSIAMSPFSEVLYMDADNACLANPEHLFSSEPFKRHGSFFFPDKPQHKVGFYLSEKICQTFGVPHEGVSAIDSGQMLVDKSLCLRQIRLALWWNQFPEYTYNVIWGDKDTFNLAWRQTNKHLYCPDTPPITGRGFLHHDHTGKLLFSHRCGAKWKLRDNEVLDKPMEARFHGFVEEIHHMSRHLKVI